MIDLSLTCHPILFMGRLLSILLNKFGIFSGLLNAFLIYKQLNIIWGIFLHRYRWGLGWLVAFLDAEFSPFFAFVFN